MKKQLLLLITLFTFTACSNKEPEKAERIEYEQDYVIQDSYDNNERRINEADKTLPMAEEEESENQEESIDQQLEEEEEKEGN